MRRLSILAAIAALSLCACSTTSTAPPGPIATVDAAATIADATGTPPPVTIADQTTIDETAGIAFESAIAAAADLATLAVRTRVVPDSKLGELRERVAWARTAVGAVRAAYDTGNARSYKAAVASAGCAIARVRTLATGAADAPCAANKGEVR